MQTSKDFDASAFRGCPACESALFINAGLRVMIQRKDFVKTALGRDDNRNTNWEGHDTVYVCSQCLLPVMHDNGVLIDLSAVISREEVAAALVKGGYQVPPGRRQETKADGNAEEHGDHD